jgi:uncharacterized protein
LVLDTNIVVSGLLWNGSPSKMIDGAIADQVALFTSKVLLVELGDVFSRDKHQSRIKRLGQTPEGLLQQYANICALVSAESLPVPIAPDPDDDWVIATALAAEADLIVTGDKPLLGVGRVGAVRIVTVGEALELVR